MTAKRHPDLFDRLHAFHRKTQLMIAIVGLIWIHISYTIVGSLGGKDYSLPLPDFTSGAHSKHDDDGHRPVIVLSTGDGKWNTGVWSGFGSEVATLAWANQVRVGVRVRVRSQTKSPEPHQNFNFTCFEF